MITGAGGANQTIVVNAFTYYSVRLPRARPVALSAGGTDTLYLAGTQAAIGAAQICRRLCFSEYHRDRNIRLRIANALEGDRHRFRGEC